MQLTMDINEFIRKFLNFHQNSITDKLLKTLEDWKNAPLYDRCSIINQIYWGSVAEGYYYCYFLQIRLAYGVAQRLYEEGEFKDARMCLIKVDRFMDFCDSYHGYLGGGTVKMNRQTFDMRKKHYEKAINKLSHLLNEKSY
jgi:hypothetical protein